MEIEIKLGPLTMRQVGDIFCDIKRLPVNGPARAIKMQTTYFDTSEGFFRQHRQTLRLRQDGAYFITFVSDFLPQQYYNVTLERDTRAPLLYFSEGALSGRVDAPVAYSPSEPDCSVEVTMQYEPYPATGWLADNGSYQLRIRDAAGNVRSYYITVDVPVGFGPGTGAAVWILIGSALAAVLFWMLHLRRKSRTI